MWCFTKDLERSLASIATPRFKEVGDLQRRSRRTDVGHTITKVLLIQVGDAPGPPMGRRRGSIILGSKSETI